MPDNMRMKTLPLSGWICLLMSVGFCLFVSWWAPLVYQSSHGWNSASVKTAEHVVSSSIMEPAQADPLGASSSLTTSQSRP